MHVVSWELSDEILANVVCERLFGSDRLLFNSAVAECADNLDSIRRALYYKFGMECRVPESYVQRFFILLMEKILFRCVPSGAVVEEALGVPLTGTMSVSVIDGVSGVDLQQKGVCGHTDVIVYPQEEERGPGSELQHDLHFLVERA
jgi:hypothetical protein